MRGAATTGVWRVPMASVSGCFCFGWSTGVSYFAGREDYD
jgi:hypothetical protein